MADQAGDNGEKGVDGGRQRAPTITINTTNTDAATASNQTAESPTKLGHSRHGSQISIPEERDSRPASPHNISSPPLSRGAPEKNFLSVPGQRSRQNSIESEEGNQSTSLSGETYTNGKEASAEKSVNNDEIMSDPEALLPDPGYEKDFEPEENSFAFSQGQLNKLINPKSLSAFYALGGLAGLEKGLRTNRKTGLSVDEGDLEGTVTFDEAKAAAQKYSKMNGNGDYKEMTTSEDSKGPTTKVGSKDHDSFYDRKRIFSDNRLPVKKGKTIWELMWITYNDKVLILLSVAAVISLAVGLYQTFGGEHKDGGAKLEWVEGVAIVVAILVVVIVGSLNDYQKERQFVKLNSKKQDRDVNVVRSGKTIEISVFDVLVGDIMHLEPGDMIPVDGIFIEGHNVKCDESQTTGESDLLKKRPADEVYAAIENHEELKKMDPFILSGAQVTEGVGKFIVTSTGVNSSYGKTMMSLREDPEVTPLQSKLNTLAEYIAKLGGAAGLILFTVLFIKFLAHLPKNRGSPSEKGQEFLNIFIVTVTIIVVAVPEGLPLAVTLALAFATTRMLKDNNLVRHLKACEVMGNATAICSDKTGTLTQNKMLVVAGTIGTSSRFGAASNAAPAAADEHSERSTEAKGKQNASEDGDSDAHSVVAALNQEVKTMLVQSIAANSTAFEGEVDGVKTFVGSKTETALLTFARDFLGMGPVDQEKSNAKITQMIPFDSGRKCMGVIIELSNGTHRLYVKGASEILLGKCSQLINEPTTGVESADMNETTRETLLGLIESYAERSLRTIGIVYKDFQQWPPKGAHVSDGDVKFEDIFKDMILLGVVGIQDPLREGVPQAVATCQKAGVVVRMVTGDNLVTARAIATECGIYTPGGVIMEGPAFRKLSKPQMDQIIPRLQVLARSSPEDKRILVKRLKELGETVAVTGDGTNDAPALKTADVGFSMGIAGTEVAKEASAIILMDDNFNSIVKAMMWGRAVNDAVRKFLQFQITVNITAVLLTFISSVSSDTETSVLTAVQLLWVNLIMDTMAALALATDPPGPKILDRKPDPKSARLISATMWKMIFGQAIYQLAVTLVLYFAGAKILRYDTPDELEELPTLVFNTFVWMQIFNQWNNRRLDNKFNIFEGVTRNYFFMGINAVMIGFQVMIIYVGGQAFNVRRLNGPQWGISVVLGLLSIPVGALIRCIPDAFLIKYTPKFFKKRRKNGPQLTISDEEEGQFQFPQPLADVKDELTFFRKFKGGRVNNLRFKVHQARETVMPRSRSGSRSRDNSHPGTPNLETDDDKLGTPAPPTPESRRRSRSSRSRSNSALGATTVMAGIIAGSVAGWSPIERREGDTEAARWPKGANARAELEGRKDVVIHPDTKPDDPVIVSEPHTGTLPPSQIPELRPEAGATLKKEEEKH